VHIACETKIVIDPSKFGPTSMLFEQVAEIVKWTKCQVTIPNRNIRLIMEIILMVHSETLEFTTRITLKTNQNNNYKGDEQLCEGN